jgi:hypothetical protein
MAPIFTNLNHFCNGYFSVVNSIISRAAQHQDAAGGCKVGWIVLMIPARR